MFSCCGEGGTLQTNNTGVCSQCLSHTGPVPAHAAQALGCSTGNCPRPPGLHAPPRSKLLRFRYSGTPQRHRLNWACVLCPSQVHAAQVTRCLASAVAAIYRLPCPCRSVFWVYNKSTSQADVDCPESQEVLVSNKVCLQFGMGCFSGAAFAPFWLWLPWPSCLWRGLGWSAAR